MGVALRSWEVGGGETKGAVETKSNEVPVLPLGEDALPVAEAWSCEVVGLI